MTAHPTRRRFTVTEYHQMGKAGILTEDDRVELIDGEIIEMAPIGRRHQACVDRLTLLFVINAGNLAQIRVQGPVRLSEQTEPQPNVALLRPRPDFYASGHPTPADVLLLVEVAETSTRYDRRVKMPLYARSGIPECWLVDLDQATFTVYRDPTPTGYRTVQTVRRGERLASLAIPDLELAVADILG
jgi:Uma2 family endonuclease